MAELVDATDLKSVGDFLRAGSIPAFRTIKNSPLFKAGYFFNFSGRVLFKHIYGQKKALRLKTVS